MGQVYDSEAGEPMDEKWSPDLSVPAERVEVVRRGKGGGGGMWGSDDPGRMGGALSPAGSKGGCAAVAGLLMVCLLAFVPGFFRLPVVDRDEARFAQASRQMFESAALPEGLRLADRHGGGWLVPMVQDRERLNTAPLIYWLQASSAAILTVGRPYADRIWMYRMPSLIAAFAVVLLTWRLGILVFDARTGAVAGALVAVSPVMAWEAHQARADMVLAGFTVLAQFAMWRVFQAATRTGAEGKFRDEEIARPGGGLRWAVVFWMAVALGIMTKGPITPMVAGITAIGLSAALGRWRWLLRLRPEVGVVIVIAAILPWVWGVAQRVGWEMYLATIRDEVWGRSISPDAGQWGPPGYHAVLLPVLFWPGSLLTAAAVGVAVRELRREWREHGLPFRRSRGTAPYAFLLAWIVPAWIIFELVGTKLPHYTMTLYPAIAILSAHGVFTAEAGLAPWLRGRMGRIGFTVWLLIGGALIGIGFAGLGMLILGGGFLRTMFFGMVGLAFAGAAFLNLKQAARSWAHGRYARAQLAGVLVGLAIVIVVIGIAVPRLITLSPAIARAIERVDPTGARPVALVHYKEDSMIFLTRGRAERMDAAALDEWFAANPRGLAVIPRELHAGRDASYEGLAAFSGFNYARIRNEHLVLIERAE